MWRELIGFIPFLITQMDQLHAEGTYFFKVVFGSTMLDGKTMLKIR
jgi:hypothetical protein